ncbi:EAL domain-containing response regulator [Vibrio sp. TRT 17S01]|uniref:EAL domain-containing response regulator n=1 Tax=Vibrio sp. TRT 17S01 TaxID=3418505 RepID=UPI003CED5097
MKLTSKVLILDDSPLQQHGTLLQLKACGIENATLAGSGQEALSLCAQQQFDLLICDLSMPHMDGLHFLKKLNLTGYNAAICILSGMDDGVLKTASTMCKLMDFSFVTALEKPATRDALFNLLTEINRTERPKNCIAQPLDITEQDLISAIQNRELVNYYQPKFSFNSMKLKGCEVLVRWQHPKYGIIGPAHFMPLVFQYGLQNSLFDCVLEQTVIAAAQTSGSCIFSVNATQTNIETENFADTILQQCRHHGVPPSHIIIELTEHEVTELSPTMLEQLARIRMNGIGLSLDDFGTGYSSLLKLSQLPFTEIKIDKEFVTTCTYDIRTQSIVEMICGLAKSMNLRIVAEGVEDQATWDYLKRVGVGLCQGSLTGMPMPLDEFLKMDA